MSEQKDPNEELSLYEKVKRMQMHPGETVSEAENRIRMMELSRNHYFGVSAALPLTVSPKTENAPLEKQDAYKERMIALFGPNAKR